MRCRVCGREIDPQKSYCEKCGSPVSVSTKADSGEFSWNTIDFPKPKAIHDIEMNWGQSGTTKRNVQPARSQASFSQPAQSQYNRKPAVQTQAAANPVQITPAPLRPAQTKITAAQIDELRNMSTQSVADQIRNMGSQSPAPQTQNINTQSPAPQTQNVNTSSHAAGASGMSYTIPQQMNWTVPQSVWTMPTQQQVYIPQPYNVQPQEINTAAPVFSAMPQMPSQPLAQPQVDMQLQQNIQPQMNMQMPGQTYIPPMYMTQPLPQVQVAPQMSWTMPQSAWTVQQPVQTAMQPQTAAPMQQPMQPQPTVSMQQPIQSQQAATLAQTIHPRMQTAMQQPMQPQQAVSMQQTIQPQMQATIQQPVQTHQTATQQLQPLVEDPRVAAMPVAPAAIKNPVNVDSWLDSELEAANSGAANGSLWNNNANQNSPWENNAYTPVQPSPINNAAAKAHADWLDNSEEIKSDKDKFFTFYKKNEDFQKLLDEEYQKYKDKYDTNAESLMKSSILNASDIRSAAAAGATAASNALSEDSRAANSKAEDSKAANSKAEDSRAANSATAQSRWSASDAPGRAHQDAGSVLSRDTQAVNPDQINRAAKLAERDTTPVVDYDAAQKASANTVIFDASSFAARAQSDAQAVASESQLQNDNITVIDDEPITEFDRMLKEGTKSPDELGDATLAISNEQLRKDIDEIAETYEKADQNWPVHAYDKNKRQQDLKDMAEARSAYFGESDEAEKDQADAQQLKTIFDQWDQERREAEGKTQKKKGGFGKFLLVLLLLIALFVAADLLCLKYMPINEVTEFFEDVNTKAIDIYTDAYTKITGKETEIEQPVALTAQELAANKLNKNIEQLSFDASASKFNSDAVYEQSNFDSMSIVTDEDTIVAATEVVVAYNSSWIDYVNGSSDITCFDYLKTDGALFRAASNFDKLGKTETFKRLNIGEVRTDGEYLYVFTDELIELTSDGSTTQIPDDPVYKLVLVGDNYKIVESL